MLIPKEAKIEHFDMKQVTDALFGIYPDEDYGSFIRNRDLRRKEVEKELKHIPENLENSRILEN